MSDQDTLTPCVFLVRHGETLWAKSGCYCGATDVDLTQEGIEHISFTAAEFVGAGKLIDPSHLAHVFVSPRLRTTRTFEILLSGAVKKENVTVTEDIAEWNYGDYEGFTAREIRALRKARGLDTEKKWDIWSDGCEGGESPKHVTERLDKLILQIRDIQRPHMKGEKPANVLLVAHGLILRCFVKRWLSVPVGFSLQLMLAPGAIVVLSYKNQNIDEPALHAGIALPQRSTADGAETHVKESGRTE